jgi:phosphate-selective porin OprO and OprP
MAGRFHFRSWCKVLVGGFLLGAATPAGLTAAGEEVGVPWLPADSLPSPSQWQGQGVGVLDEAPPFTMRIGARVQVRHTFETEEDSNTLQIRRGRLSLGGEAYERFDYFIQLELAGSQVRLFDANVRYALRPELVLWAGQGKAPFGRQQLVSSGALHFVDRSIVDGRFSVGRQQGLSLGGQLGGDRVEYATGIYNGNGINQSSNPGGRVMSVGRVVLTPFGSLPLLESGRVRSPEQHLAVGVAGMNNTVEEETGPVEISRMNGELVYRVGGWSATGEVYREWARETGSPTDVSDGWYAQLGYLLPSSRHEVAARWAVVDSGLDQEESATESGLGYSYYFRGNSAKIQADVRNIRMKATGDDNQEFRVQFNLAL